MSQILFWALAVLAATGALAVVFTRDVLRLALGLGAFLLAIAGFFALLGFGFLALAQVFVYVGGVLVLVLFAIMLVHRAEVGSPRLDSRHNPAAAIACAGVGALVVTMLRPLAPLSDVVGVSEIDALADVLLSDLLPQFELAGLLLLAALVAVVSVAGGGNE